MIAGEITYFTGKPCVNGHISDRFTSNGNCRICGNERCEKWSNKNKDLRLSYYKKYRDGNKEALKRKGAEYRKENPEKVAAIQKRWNDANKEKRREYASETAHRRRAMKRLVRSDLTRQEIDEVRKKQGGRCAYCKARSRLQIDHIIALSRGGENTKRNIQMLCKPCNLSKGAKHPIEFAQKIGLLL